MYITQIICICYTIKLDFFVISRVQICSMAQHPRPLQRNLMILVVTNAESEIPKMVLISRKSQTSGFHRSTLESPFEKHTSLTSPFPLLPLYTHPEYQSLLNILVFSRLHITKYSPRMAYIKITLLI